MHIRVILLSACTVVASAGAARAASATPPALHVVVAATGESAIGNGAEFTSSGEVAAVVTQREKVFEPGSVDLRVGQSIEIVNDDTTVHNVFCQSPEFKYNSGPQQPGSRAKITFTVAGRFEIRCAIHPKMRLVVTVAP